jgi:hypothetical protein
MQRMVANGHAVLPLLRYEIRETLGVYANHEERRVHVPYLELREDPGRPDRIGAVVESQRDLVGDR